MHRGPLHTVSRPQPKLCIKNEPKHIWPDEKLPRTCNTLLKVKPAIKIPPGRTEGIFFLFHYFLPYPPALLGNLPAPFTAIDCYNHIMFKMPVFNPLTVMSYIKTKPKESSRHLNQHAHSEQTGSCLNGATASTLSCNYSVEDQSTSSLLTT